MPRLAFRRTPGIIRREVGSDVLLLDPRDESLHVLNTTAAVVWDLLVGPRSAEELVADLAQRFEVAPGDAVARDITHLLESLVARGLVRELPAGPETP